MKKGNRSPPGAEPKRLSDLVGVRPHPTVVRLEDLDGKDAEWITSAYHVTADVERHLAALRHALARPAGSGAFVIGQYGSGKSHFLAYVARSLRAGRLVDSPPDVVTLSLLNFRAQVSLEDIVTKVAGVETTLGDRRSAWRERERRSPRGIVLLIDELSEFLRSKPDRQSFNEDVRFLQFLGEWAQTRRFWIMAAVQEEIEHTGELEHAVYRKIKDRYPLRFLLSPAHVRDLLAESILIKKPGYEPAVEKLVRDLQASFPEAPVDFETLRAIYPLHPVTIELLEEVRDRFSQARGIVDFAVTRLAGDSRRGAEPFLEQPWGSLVAPNLIIDHFRDLFEVQPEFIALAQQLFPYYRKHLARILSTEKLRELGQKLLELLVLVYLSPSRRGLTAEEATHWLLHKVTRLDPRRNVEVIRRTLGDLAREGCYVACRDGVFSLELGDDGGVALERFLKREKETLEERGEGVLELVAPLLAGGDFDPFVLPRDEWQGRAVRWHFHDRAYSVYLGNGMPPPRERIKICLRLPWGEATSVPGAWTFLPAALETGEDVRELAALAAARDRPWSPETKERVEARLAERLTLFRARVRNAYIDSSVVGPRGEVETPTRGDPPRSFVSFLEGVAQWVLRRTYPSFERFAPCHGPLPKEAYRALMRSALERDLGEYETDELVKLVREAYLVPMGLMQRRGQHYELPRNPEGNELVRLVLPLLESQPPPKIVYEHLAGPVYGLVPDQVSLLLVYLLLLGEIDLLKERRSYREIHETLPNPIHYERIVPGRALRLEELHELEKLFEGLRIRPPAQWTVIAQRQAAKRLRDAAKPHVESFHQVIAKLKSAGRGEKLVARLESVVSQWAALHQGEDDLHGLRQFLFEIGSASRFFSTLSDLRDIPKRVDQLLGELDRYRHLFGHPGVRVAAAEALLAGLETLGEPPDLDEPDALDAWLRRARDLYARHKKSYRGRHDAWWEEIARQPVWSWEPAAVASLRQLDLEGKIAAFRVARRRAADLRCRGAVDLDFQPICACGFDGETSPVAEALETTDGMRAEIDDAVSRFFGRADVRARLRQWLEDGLDVTPGLSAYLDGDAPFPDAPDVESLDRYLAGVELVKEVDAAPILELLCERTWEPPALLDELGRWLEGRKSPRLRFRSPPKKAELRSEVIAWCAEQALAHGAPLPRAFSAAELETLAGAVRPEWVGTASLSRLERLGLGERAVDRIVSWLLEGRIRAPERAAASPLVASALEALRPGVPATFDDLAMLAARLYRHHHRMRPVGGETWLRRLDDLAETRLEDGEELGRVLERRNDLQWLVVDALGLPLLPAAREGLDALLPHWRVETVEFAESSKRSTTDEFWRDLARRGVKHALEKVNAIDRLLHERFLPFDDLEKLALAELGAALKHAMARLDPGRPVLLLADHGFRIARDGRAYTHGGSTTLERVVPVISLVPR